MFPPYKYIITRILRNVNKNIRKIRKNSRDFHTTKLNLPTGNLDSKSCKAVIDSFLQAKQQIGATIFMVTHDSYAASFCDRVIVLKDGMVYQEVKKTGTRREFMDELLDILRNLGGDSDDNE